MKKLIIIAAIILFTAPALAQQVFNPHTGQWERSNQPPKQPDIHTPPAGAIDSRTGTVYAPHGSGVVDTSDGTEWYRNGDMLINSRTGEMIHSPERKEDRKKNRRGR